MVTIEELKNKKYRPKSDDNKASFHITAADLKRFEVNKELNMKVYNKLTKYTTEHNIKPKYTGLEEICQLSETSLKKSCAGTQKITRYFLYKFTVGLKMKPEEANEYFSLCGGLLREDDLEDFICLKALEDGDDIIHFINQFNEALSEYDKFQTTDKLKKLYE